MGGDQVSRRNEVAMAMGMEMEMEGITVGVVQLHQVMQAEVLHLKRPPDTLATRHISLPLAKEEEVVDGEEESPRGGILFVNNKNKFPEGMAESGGLRHDERKIDAH
jgi:hypothetical protein